MTKLCLYVDDCRPTPASTPEEEWLHAWTFHAAICILEERQDIEVVSLDHDLGCFYGMKEMTGRDILNWLISRKLDSYVVPTDIRVHSANPVGCAIMEADIKRYWGT